MPNVGFMQLGTGYGLHFCPYNGDQQRGTKESAGNSQYQQESKKYNAGLVMPFQCHFVSV